MQVLTTQGSEFEERILGKLSGYTRPVKTKHLAERLNIDRADLVAVLNDLRIKGKISYTKKINLLSDSRGRDDMIYGWVLA